MVARKNAVAKASAPTRVAASQVKAGATNTDVSVAVAKPPKTNGFPTDEAMRKEGLDTLSARIRHLKSLGCETAEIARIVKRENGEHPRYQHVRNVLLTPIKKPSDAANENGDSTASQDEAGTTK